MFIYSLRQGACASLIRRRSGWAISALVLVGLLLGVAVVGVVAHYRAPHRGWMVGISAFSPYLMLAAPVALLVLVIGREWLAGVLALALTLICASTEAGLYLPVEPPAHAPTLVVMTANLRKGRASPTSVIDAVRRHEVDALMLEELTPKEQSRLVTAGLNLTLPFHITDPRPSASGTGLWSRWPLTDEVKRTGFANAFVTARVHLKGVPEPVQLAALHISNAYPDSAGWLSDITHLRMVLHGSLAKGTTVVGGDLNATPDLKQFRDLLTNGWADAADQAGAGVTPTYPSDWFGYPLLAVDHVLSRSAVATTAYTVRIGDSDHRALVVRLALK